MATQADGPVTMAHIAASLGVSDPQVVDALCRASTSTHLKKGEVLLRQGQPQRSISFVVKGVIRSYSVDSAGVESTNCILDRPSLPAVPSADLHGCSIETIEALTPCDVVSLDIATLDELVATDLSVAHAYIAILNRAWQFHWSTKMLMRQQDARGRYQWFLDNYPGVIDQIPHYHIASFLGMTPVTLARVRKSMREQEPGPEGTGRACEATPPMPLSERERERERERNALIPPVSWPREA